MVEIGAVEAQCLSVVGKGDPRLAPEDLATLVACRFVSRDEDANILTLGHCFWTPLVKGSGAAAAPRTFYRERWASAGLLDEALGLANHSPCSPQTLTRAARDFKERDPYFAMEAGLTALHWMAQGYGYDITVLDVSAAYEYAMQAAQNADCAEYAQSQIEELLERAAPGASLVARVLGERFPGE